ncbi:MAG: hypothetical protein WEA35_06380 [Candidatus Nanopelagicales bacterium]
MASRRLEELDWASTPMGDLSLRRRLDPLVGVEVFEVKLGEEFLMSSLFTVAEMALATLALDLLDGAELDVVVGGLGLGYTATTVLEDPRVRSLLVVERLAPVIDWHERELVPAAVTSSQRTGLVHEDFFALAAGTGFDPDTPHRRFDAVLLDVDHSPRHLLNVSHEGFYTPEGTARLAEHLHPGGVYALWSNDPPDDDYVGTLRTVFSSVHAEVVEFANPLQSRLATNTVYLAQHAGD